MSRIQNTDSMNSKTRHCDLSIYCSHSDFKHWLTSNNKNIFFIFKTNDTQTKTIIDNQSLPDFQSPYHSWQVSCAGPLPLAPDDSVQSQCTGSLHRLERHGTVSCLPPVCPRTPSAWQSFPEQKILLLELLNYYCLDCQ